ADTRIHEVPVAQRDLADSTREVRIRRRTVWLTKGTRHLVKLRHQECDEVLAREYGDWGSVLECKPAISWQSEATFHSHGEGLPFLGDGPLAVPARQLRVYRDVTWHGWQIFTKGDHVLPDSFRH